MKTLAQLQYEIDRWNSLYEIGTPVVVLLDSGEWKKDKTRTAAQIFGGHSAVIWLEGISGCYALERITPAEPKARKKLDAPGML